MNGSQASPLGQRPGPAPIGARCTMTTRFESRSCFGPWTWSRPWPWSRPSIIVPLAFAFSMPSAAGWCSGDPPGRRRFDRAAFRRPGPDQAEHDRLNTTRRTPTMPTGPTRRTPTMPAARAHPHAHPPHTTPTTTTVEAPIARIAYHPSAWSTSRRRPTATHPAGQDQRERAGRNGRPESRRSWRQRAGIASAG